MKGKLDHILRDGELLLLDSIGDAISIQDTNLEILYQNRQHIQLMGRHVGKKCYEAFQHRDSACPDCHLLKAFREKRTNRRTGSTNYSRRGRVHVEITSSPLMDAEGNVSAGIEAVRDITEQKLVDERLKAITCDLEQKTWKLMAANKELEAFNYTLSHDISNYLARISMAAETLAVDTSGVLNETGTFLLGSINESCEAMHGMIDAILRLSSAGQGAMAREDADLGQIAREVAEELKGQFPGHNVDFYAETGLAASGDLQLLRVMLRNLLGNAWKYTQGVPAPQVSFAMEEHDGKKVFAVRDNGVGFDMNESARLFKPFARLSSSAGHSGSGIGLATVRRIALCHGGDVWGEGAPGAGATFYFTLP